MQSPVESTQWLYTSTVPVKSKKLNRALNEGAKLIPVISERFCFLKQSGSKRIPPTPIHRSQRLPGTSLMLQITATQSRVEWVETNFMLSDTFRSVSQSIVFKN